MVYSAERIVILKLSLYYILVYKMHPNSKLGNDIIYIYARELVIKRSATLKYIAIDCCLVF